MKKLFALPILFVALYFISNQTNYAQDNPSSWKYFKMYVTVSDDAIFTKLQDDCELDKPYLTSYTLNVDIRSDDPRNQVIIFGDKNLKSSPRFAWCQLSKEVQDGLIKWDKQNKVKLD